MVYDIVGQVFDNDGAALRQALEACLDICHFRHRGDFVFTAVSPGGRYVVVSTIPVDEENKKIQVISLVISTSRFPISQS